MPGDRCKGIEACTFCTAGRGEDLAGVLLFDITGEPGPSLDDAVNGDGVIKVGKGCGAEPIPGMDGGDCTLGGIIYGCGFAWLGLR
jgi:hypothetical protein